MAWPETIDARIRREAHFGDRLVRCIADRPADLDTLVRSVVSAHGERTALVFESRRLSYLALDQAVARVAGNLAGTAGVAHGDRVALYSGNCLEFALVVLACLRLGAICVPLGYRLQTPELDYMLRHSGAKAIIVEAQLAARVPALDSLPEMRIGFAFEGDAAGYQPFDDLLVDAEVAPTPIGEEDIAFILYTSGTTGRPKGATLTHFNVIHTILHYQTCMGLSADDSTLIAVPVTHVTGLVAQLLTMIGVGGQVVIMRSFKAHAALALMAEEKVRHSIMVPAMYNLMLRDPEFDRFDLSSLTLAGFGGAPMPEATILELERRLPGLNLRNAYGATETTSPATILPRGKIASHRHTVGMPVPCADIVVVDGDGRELPDGETGEIWIAGPMVVPGYWRNPDANAAEFTGGYWHSGDIGAMTEDGYLRILDRRKDMINRGGYKVFSAEVENVLAQHDQVVESAVVGRPCPVLGERVHAFVVSTETDTCDEATLKAFCAERLADYKVPETYSFLNESLPRNANGKVMKPTLRARAEAMFDQNGQRRLA